MWFSIDNRKKNVFQKCSKQLITGTIIYCLDFSWNNGVSIKPNQPTETSIRQLQQSFALLSEPR